MVQYQDGSSGSPSRVLCLGGWVICSSVMDIMLGSGCRVVVLDSDRECRVADRCRIALSKDLLWEEERPVLLVEDALDGAIEILDRYQVDLVVPGIPGHAAGKLAMNWGHGRLAPRGSEAVLQVTEAVLKGTGTVSMDQDNGTMICTLNTGSAPCPTGCTQEGICPITGRPRIIDMDDALDEVLERLSIKGMVIRPVRVGDYGAITAGQIEETRQLLDNLEKGNAVAIATSCSCHAIMNVFKVC